MTPVLDDEVDRAVAAALAVEPSPEFLARVRMRIDSEPKPSHRRPSWTWVAAACTIAIASAISSTSRPPRREKPTPEVQAIMRAFSGATTALAAHVRERNYVAIADDAATLQRNVADTEALWQERRMDAALGITKSALVATVSLYAAARAKDDAAIRKAAAAVTGACNACHQHYHVELPGGAYEIRL
jgi:cytochrome c556